MTLENQETRQVLALAIEALIDVLDTLEADPDLEMTELASPRLMSPRSLHPNR